MSKHTVWFFRQGGKQSPYTAPTKESLIETLSKEQLIQDDSFCVIKRQLTTEELAQILTNQEDAANDDTVSEGVHDSL